MNQSKRIINVCRVGVLQKHKWENAMTIDKQSWGYRADARIEDFLTKEELIKGKYFALKSTALLVFI